MIFLLTMSTLSHYCQGNHNAGAIQQRCGLLQEKLDALRKAADNRKARLVDNSAFLQFIWKTDVVESWIGQCLFNACSKTCGTCSSHPKKIFDFKMMTDNCGQTEWFVIGDVKL